MSEKKNEETDERDQQAKSLGAIKCIEVEQKRLYLKKPPRHIIGIAFAQMSMNAVQAYETIAKACAVRECSDMEILENDDLFMSAMAGLGDFVSEIKLKKSTSRSL